MGEIVLLLHSFFFAVRSILFLSFLSFFSSFLRRPSLSISFPSLSANYSSPSASSLSHPLSLSFPSPPLFSLLPQVPDVNAAWMDKFVRRYEQVDINLVMGTGQGLLTPVIRDVGSRGLKSISSEVEALEDSLFSEGGKEIDAAKMAVGTFSIHNLGGS